MNFTFFSSAHETFFRIDHILGHISSLGKFRKIEIIPSIFSDHNAVRLDLNYRRETIKNSKIWRLNNTLLNNQQITEEIKKEIKICIEMNENENITTQNLWDTVKAVSHRFWVVVSSFPFVSMHILISFLISSVICWLFSSVLFSLHMLGVLIVFSCN